MIKRRFWFCQKTLRFVDPGNFHRCCFAQCYFCQWSPAISTILMKSWMVLTTFSQNLHQNHYFCRLCRFSINLNTWSNNRSFWTSSLRVYNENATSRKNRRIYGFGRNLHRRMIKNMCKFINNVDIAQDHRTKLTFKKHRVCKSPQSTYTMVFGPFQNSRFRMRN